MINDRHIPPRGHVTSPITSMSAFSFRRPRFLRRDDSRSPSQKPPQTDSRNDVSHPPGQPLNSQYLGQPSGQLGQQRQQPNPGMFNQAHNFTVTGTFIENYATSHNAPSNQFMEKLLEKTIRGAEFDSSARDPPPRCHPGTRLAILKRCLSFITNCDGKKKVCWVVGAAGVGKSAIMQSVAECQELLVASHASVFFSINGRNDGIKTVTTLSYQFAAKSELYRELIEKEINRDPSLLESSMAKQFLKLIVEPFIHNPQLNSAGRILIIIDGLDECNNSLMQVNLLRLISDVCITYPSSPLVWLIASRPEMHITSFFSRTEVVPVYEKELIAVDSDESRADVERFLRDELMDIKKVSDSLDPEWPEERDVWKLANAAGGLFAYAQTVVRYIGDSVIGSPASQLSDVLHVIDNHLMTDVPREEHPMASLDALYARILSNVPSRIMINTRKLLLALMPVWDRSVYGKESFVVLCNLLGMTPDEAYAAVNRLRSVLHVPRRDQAHSEKLQPFHKSFIDYVFDFNRSGFCRGIRQESQRLGVECVLRILKEAPDGVDIGEADYTLSHGSVMRGPGTGDQISLAWPVDKAVGLGDNEMRLHIYKLAIREVVAGMADGEPAFQSEHCIRLLTSRFRSYPPYFPYYKFCDFVFHESRRYDFINHGILKPMPLKEVDISQKFRGLKVKIRFRRPDAKKSNSPDSWSSSCVSHRREDVLQMGKKEEFEDWTTMFSRSECTFCSERFDRQLENCMRRSPEHGVLIVFSSTGECCVEIRFVDPEDGVSKWVYWVWCRVPLDVRKKYGSIV